MTNRRLAIALCLTVLACVHPKAELVVSSPIVDRLAPASAIKTAPVESLPQVVDATYRLRPDRRILLAVSDVLALSTGRRAPVEIDFVQDRWTLRCDKRDAGTLPDIPTFADGMAMLTKWAAAVRPSTIPSSSPAVLASMDRDLAELTVASLFRAAAAVDPVPGLDLPAASRLARALTVINLMADADRFGLSDPLRARALALIAMTRAIDPSAVAEEQAVMAGLMRYDVEASAAAAGLAPGSFARVWITRAGSPAPQNNLSDYVAAAVAVRAATQLSAGEVLAPLRARLGDRVVPLLLDNLSFETRQDVSRRVSAFMATGQETADLDQAEVLGAFESMLPGRAASMASAVADRDVVAAYYQSVFYSAVDAEFQFHLRSLASAESTTDYLRPLKAKSETGRDVLQWMSTMFQAKYGAPAASLGSIDKLRNVGAARRAELIDAIGDRVGDNDSAVRLAADTLFPQLDTRPEGLFRAGLLSTSIIGDPLRRDRYMEAVIARAPLVLDYGSLAWYYRIIRDEERLRRLADRQDARGADRARALSYLAELGHADDDFIDARFDRLLTEMGPDGIYPTYAEILNRRHAWKLKERVARRVIASAKDLSPLSAAYYASSLADALEQQGRYKEAWTIVQPHAPVWSENIISIAVSLLQRLGREAQANDLGRQMVERYSSGRFDFAPVLWREHRYADAARLFDPKTTKLSQTDWNNWMPDAFIETFEHDIPGAVAAFRALADLRIDPALLEKLPSELLARKNPAAAFALAEQLVETRPPAPRDPYSASHLILAYRALAAWKDEATAMAWLRQRIRPDTLLETVVIAFENGQYPLVLALKAPVPDPSEQIQIGTIYAAALTILRVPHSDPRWAQLSAETETQSVKVNTLVDMTRYLIGSVDEKTIAASRETPSTVEYFIGLKSAAEGDYDRALPFLLVAARGSMNEPPPAWAGALLYRWDDAGTWSDVKRKRIL